MAGTVRAPPARWATSTCGTCSPRTRRRGEELVCRAGDLYLDYSKNRLNRETIRLLVALAERAGLRERTEAMFRGEHINVTEDRAVLHVALRDPGTGGLEVDGQDMRHDVQEVLGRMADFADRVRSGEWTGHTGERIRAVVNIGIGGSDLGPAMAYLALRDYSDRSLTFRFVSNIDPTDLAEATRDLDPATTLFIVASKTFTTQETLTNATEARRWLLDGLGGDETAVAEALRRRLDERGEGRRVRHRHRQHVRLLGLGRRPLLVHGGHRPLAHGRHRPRRTTGRCSTGSTPWTSTSAPRPTRRTCRRCWA